MKLEFVVAKKFHAYPGPKNIDSPVFKSLKEAKLYIKTIPFVIMNMEYL